MDQLAGYGSDSDTEDCSLRQVPPRNDNTTDSSKSSGKKKLNISILPQEIQDALAKGLDDSDDESPKPKTSSFRVNNINSDDLLAKLPLPTNLLSNNSSSKDLSVDEEPLNGGKIEATRPNALFSEYIVRKPQSMAFSSVSNGNESSNMSSFADPELSLASDRASNLSSSLGIPSSDINNVYGISSASSNKRKRERDLEQQLASGNLLVANHIVSHDVNFEQFKWNQIEYDNQTKREQELREMYSGGAQAGGGVQPSKLQNRKHQINSLAMKAAETEIKMLEVKANRVKTKSETQAKYGW